MAKLKLYDSPSWLHNQFVYQKKTIEELAEMCSCSQNTIRDRLKKLKLIK